MQWARWESPPTPLPLHDSPRLCGELIAGADRKKEPQAYGYERSRRELATHGPGAAMMDAWPPHLQGIAAAHGALGLLVFGSVVHGAAWSGSDPDLLVEFSASPSFEQHMNPKLALEDLLSVPVDLVIRRVLRTELRQHIEGEAIPLA
jgi:predicted nucleotidyltransferase